MDNTILHFIQEAFADKTNSKMIFEFHALSEEQVAVLLEKTGYDLTGYRRVLDSFAVRHIFKNHGNDKTEALRGQIGVVEADFLLIERVVGAFEVFSIDINQIGNVMFQYKFELDAFRLVYAEEIRAKRKELATLTLYKQKIRKL